MEILLIIVAWFAIGFAVAIVFGAAASVGDFSHIKSVIPPSEIALKGVSGTIAHLDATEVIGRRQMRRKQSVCYLLLAGWR